MSAADQQIGDSSHQGKQAELWPAFPSHLRCAADRLFTLAITEREVKDLLSHTDSPYIRAVGAARAFSQAFATSKAVFGKVPLQLHYSAI